jgi:hypothetical protein
VYVSSSSAAPAASAAHGHGPSCPYCQDFHGVSVHIDKDDTVGWMSDWSAPYDQDWFGQGWVVSVAHNSGGLGGASYQLTNQGKAQLS